MSKPVPVPCPRCNGPASVTIFPQEGGRGCGDLTSYYAECESCGHLVSHLSGDGRKATAVRDYNRWVRENKARLAGEPLPRATRKVVPQIVVTEPARTEWVRGFYCAVAVALREGYDNSARSLFGHGGDPALADPDDIALFRDHGLMK